MNRIIVPARFNVFIEIKFDTQTGQSELVFKDGTAPVSQLVVAGLLLSHSNEMIKGIIVSGNKKVATENDKENGNA